MTTRAPSPNLPRKMPNHWHDFDYVQDVECQLYVTAFPDGMSIEDISIAMGVSHQCVSQIYGAAIRKLYQNQRASVIGIRYTRPDRCRKWNGRWVQSR